MSVVIDKLFEATEDISVIRRVFRKFSKNHKNLHEPFPQMNWTLFRLKSSPLLIGIFNKESLFRVQTFMKR